LNHSLIAELQLCSNIRIWSRRSRKHHELARHAQVDHQDQTTLQIDKHPLCATAYPFNAPTGNRSRERFGIWRAEICGAKDSRCADRCAAHKARKITRNRFNLWEFRHARSTSASHPSGGQPSPPR
jgi:hypothetical protein